MYHARTRTKPNEIQGALKHYLSISQTNFNHQRARLLSQICCRYEEIELLLRLRVSLLNREKVLCLGTRLLD